jgi:hypothetical protein
MKQLGTFLKTTTSGGLFVLLRLQASVPNGSVGGDANRRSFIESRPQLGELTSQVR